MGKTITIDVNGVDKLERDLILLSKTKRLRQTIGIATAIVEGAAKTLCPKDTGRLANSIHMSVDDKTDEIVGKVSTNTEYAPYVEFGTGIRGSSSNYPMTNGLRLSYSPDRMGQTAQPYMYPALKQNKTKINKLITDALRNEL